MSAPVLELELPDHFLPEQKRAVESLISSRFTYEVDVKWQLDRYPMRALVIPAPEWSGMVKFADVVPLMEECEPGKILMGMTREGKPFYRSFTGETPHWGCYVNTGLGKSTMFNVTGAQILHQEPDSTLICIDPKAVSFDPLIGIPGVTVYNDPNNVPEMWKGVSDHLAVVNQRRDALRKDRTLRFPTQALLLDEASVFALLTKMEWGDEKGTPTVWQELMMALCAGRQFNCYVVIVSQRMDDASTGRIGVRTLLNLKTIAGFGPADWKLFIGTHPIPRDLSKKGRWLYVNGPERTWVQNVFSDIQDNPLEIRNYAMANRSGLIGSQQSAETAGIGTHWVTGLEAGAAHLGLSTEAFKKRRQRNPVPGELRSGNQPRWSTGELDAWATAEKEAVA